MTTSIDTNIFIALWDDLDTLNNRAQRSLDRVYSEGGLVISGAVFAELVAGPQRSSRMIEQFLDDTGISIEWNINERVWRSAGAAFQSYSRRRRKQKQSEPKRLLTDFIIGAHALENGHRLLTLDNRVFRAAFPKLSVLST